MSCVTAADVTGSPPNPKTVLTTSEGLCARSCRGHRNDSLEGCGALGLGYVDTDECAELWPLEEQMRVTVVEKQMFTEAETSELSLGG